MRTEIKGGHWVLVVGRAMHLGKASDYTVLDPLSNKVVVTKGSTSYTSGHGAVLFTGWGVQIFGAKPGGSATHGCVKVM